MSRQTVWISLIFFFSLHFLWGKSKFSVLSCELALCCSVNCRETYGKAQWSLQSHKSPPKPILKSSYLNISCSTGSWRTVWAHSAPSEMMLATLPCLLWNRKVRFSPFFFLHIFLLYRKRRWENGINIWYVDIHTHPHEKRCHQELKVLRNSVFLGITPEAWRPSAAGFHMLLSIIHPIIDPTWGCLGRDFSRLGFIFWVDI